MHRPAPRRPRRLAALTVADVARAACSGGRAAASADGRCRQRAAVHQPEPCPRLRRRRRRRPRRDCRPHGRRTAARPAESTGVRRRSSPSTPAPTSPCSRCRMSRTEPAELSDGAPSRRHVADTRRRAARRARLDRTPRRARHDRRRAPRAPRAPHLPGRREGTSGAPLVDDDNRVLGIVVLSEPADDVAYAVTAGELAALIEHASGSVLPAPDECPG